MGIFAPILDARIWKNDYWYANAFKKKTFVK